MAVVVVVATTPGLTAAQYEQMMTEQGLTDSLPGGCLVHVSGETAEGWQVTSVWESAELEREFATATVRPALARLGVTVPSEPPATYELHTLLTV